MRFAAYVCLCSALTAMIPHSLRGIALKTICSIEISFFLNLLVIQLIPNKHIAIDLRLLFIQRNMYSGFL